MRRNREFSRTSYIFELARNPQIRRDGKPGVGEHMKHYTIWDWADFVRGVAEDKARAAMQAHLSSGCSPCERTVRVLSAVTNAARGEAQYDPPDRAMRYARALYALHRPEKTGFARLIGRLIHDSA